MSLHVLIVNDDGIQSPMMHQLCQTLSLRGHQVFVCAPQTQQSGKSHCFTIFEPVLVRPVSIKGAESAWAVSGTPVDCTRIGLTMFSSKGIDLVISGINDGVNLALATYVSGTVGAAREAAFQGKKAMSVSIGAGAPQNAVDHFCNFIADMAQHLAVWPAPEQSVLNINMPPLPPHELKKPVFAPISHHVYQDAYEQRISPRGDTYFWLCHEIPDADPEPDSDVAYFRNGHITCTFLETDHSKQTVYQGFLDA